MDNLERRERLNHMKKQLQEKILSSIDFSREVPDEEIREMIDGQLIEECRGLPLPVEEKLKLRKELFHSIRKLDVLQELVDDPTVTEIMVNGIDSIFIERQGRIIPYDLRFDSKEKLEDVIQQIVARCNRVVNEASPIVDARLENGSRVNVVLAPVALNGPVVTIRRFPERPVTMNELAAYGSITLQAVRFLDSCVKAGYNIFISGGTGSGKTTFLNALSGFIPKEERIITIEDNAELQLMDIPNLVRLETRNANVEGCAEITIRDLIRTSLRMRPTRIIVGEVRGAEAIDLLQCMNTGHDGSMSTGHANSCRDMFSRLETMILMGMELPLAAIRKQIVSGIDLVVHLGRLRDRSRKVLEIAEVTGMENGEIVTNPLFLFKEEGEDKHGKVRGSLCRKAGLINRDKLRAAGLDREAEKEAEEPSQTHEK